MTGVDVDRGAVAAAAALVPEATFLIGDAADPPPGPFAAAVAVQLLEHVANPVAVLRAAPAPVVVATVWGRESECDARLFAEALAPVAAAAADRGRARRRSPTPTGCARSSGWPGWRSSRSTRWSARSTTRTPTRWSVSC